MADNPILKYALFAGAGYLAYKQGWLSVLGLGPASVPVVAAVPGSVPPLPVQGKNQLDHIYAGMVAAASADKISVTGPDVWNVYAVRSGGPNPMPAPEEAGLSRVDMTAAQYWAGMAPIVKTKLGLSGLGIYGGLGQISMRYAR